MIDTLEYYNQNAAAFIAGTVDLDMSATHSHFAACVPHGGTVLDLGCGSGRDSAAFQRMGYRVTAVDGSAELCRQVRDRFGIEARCLRFDRLDEREAFDGIWANASLLHVPRRDIHRVLAAVERALRPDGVLYMSFKYGTREREDNGRFFSDYTEEDIPFLLEGTGMTCREWWLTEDARPEQAGLRWLNMLCVKK